MIRLLLTMQSYFEQALAQLVQFEGCVPWMYLDTVGKVTVGVGLMLPDPASAQALPFHLAGQPATPDQIAADFHRVATLPKAKLPNFYRTPTSLELDLPTITGKLRIVLAGFEQKLRDSLKGYDAFPDGVKQALLDMAYNLGPAGLLHEYPHFLAAIEAGNWTQAAAGCTRRGPAPARNAWTRASILSAIPIQTIQAKSQPEAQPEAQSWAYRLGRLLWWLPNWILHPRSPEQDVCPRSLLTGHSSAHSPRPANLASFPTDSLVKP